MDQVRAQMPQGGMNGNRNMGLPLGPDGRPMMLQKQPSQTMRPQMGPDGRPMRLQMVPDGRQMMPPMGPDGRPMRPPMGPDGRPMMPPMGPDGRPMRPPMGPDGRPMRPALGPDGRPMRPQVGPDGRPMMPEFGQDGRPMRAPPGQDGYGMRPDMGEQGQGMRPGMPQPGARLQGNMAPGTLYSQQSMTAEHHMSNNVNISNKNTAQKRNKSLGRQSASKSPVRSQLIHPRIPKSEYINRKSKISDDEFENNFAEEYTQNGGLKTFKRLAVLNISGDLGEWTGFNWKAKRVSDIMKVTYDKNGNLWFINKDFSIGKLTKNGQKGIGHLGNEDIIDIAFDSNNKLWSVNIIGELLAWNGFMWAKKNQAGFHKLKSIAFDRKGSLWAVNTACEIAVFDEADHCWDQKDVPGSVRVSTLDFDDSNKLWILGMNGQLMLLSGNKWINFGWVGCWKMQDISFRREAIKSVD